MTNSVDLIARCSLEKSIAIVQSWTHADCWPSSSGSLI